MKAGRRGRAGDPVKRRRAAKKKLPYSRCRYDHKRTWTSRRLADEAAASIVRRGDGPEQAYVYWCPVAGGWHVSTQPQGEFDRKQVLSNGRGGMTDHSIKATVEAIDTYGGWAQKLEEKTVELACPCGRPIELRLGGASRELKAGPHDPAAELLTVTVEIVHHGEHRLHGLSAYVVASRGEPQLDHLEGSEGEQEPGEQDQPA